MNRYLLEISYVGTRFRGIQKTINKQEISRLDTTTIQGSLELALRVFRPVNDIQTVLSSRTDAGVHALHSTLHVDLQRYDGKPYSVSNIIGVLNRTLAKQSLPIRILNARIVPNTFHCRYNAVGRTYLYRIAVAKAVTNEVESLKNKSFESFLPVEELDRCFFLQKRIFDLERMRNASQMLLGRHDFRSFMSTSHQKSSSRDNHPMFTVRSIDEINIVRGKTTAIGTNAILAEDLYDYWDIEVKAKSFIYKQIRRMVGALLAVASDNINEKCLYEMLTVPSKHSWKPSILLAPACGLYLSRVHYHESDLKLEE